MGLECSDLIVLVVVGTACVISSKSSNSTS